MSTGGAGFGIVLGLFLFLFIIIAIIFGIYLLLSLAQKTPASLAGADSTFNFSTNKWYKVVLVWELYRIPYNALMLIVGFVGILIFSVNIPFVYILVGLFFNIIYTLMAPIDLICKKRYGKNYSRKIFKIYLIISSCIVIISPLFLLLSLGWR